jgi:hypothetical protein
VGPASAGGRFLLRQIRIAIALVLEALGNSAKMPQLSNKVQDEEHESLSGATHQMGRKPISNNDRFAERLFQHRGL